MYLLSFATVTTIQAGEYFVKQKDDARRGEPTADMALVYVFRPASVGGAIKTWTFADDQLIGLSKAHGYYFALVPEGKHLFWSKAENTSAIEFDVKGGETYYLKTAIKMGLAKARVKLIEVDEAQAEKFFSKCAYCEPTEEGRARAQEIVANRREKAQTKADKQAKAK
jgi:hypothetical protein